MKKKTMTRQRKKSGKIEEERKKPRSNKSKKHKVMFSNNFISAHEFNKL